MSLSKARDKAMCQRMFTASLGDDEEEKRKQGMFFKKGLNHEIMMHLYDFNSSLLVLLTFHQS